MTGFVLLKGSNLSDTISDVITEKGFENIQEIYLNSKDTDSITSRPSILDNSGLDLLSKEYIIESLKEERAEKQRRDSFKDGDDIGTVFGIKAIYKPDLEYSQINFEETK